MKENAWSVTAVKPSPAAYRADFLKKKFGWETWIRTKIDGVRVRCSTIELFPNGQAASCAVGVEGSASIIEFAVDANIFTPAGAIF